MKILSREYWTRIVPLRTMGIRLASIISLEFVVYLAIFVYILVPDLPRSLEEAIDPTRAPRFIYFKLPLEQTKYHWVFEERTTFLAGTLTLRIDSVDGEELITVFDRGSISEDWVELGCRSEASNDEIYFGFKSRQKFSIANGESVEMLLHMSANVEGVGPHTRGILRAGDYHSNNKFKVYFTDDDTAYLSEKKWAPQWDLEITQKTGWMEERVALVDSAVTTESEAH